MTVDAVVVGSGVTGLTTALRLQERGVRVQLVTAHPPGGTVSAVAAAVWYPTGVEPAPTALRRPIPNSATASRRWPTPRTPAT